MSTWLGSSLRYAARLEHLLDRLEVSSSKADEGATVVPLAGGRSALTVFPHCFPRVRTDWKPAHEGVGANSVCVYVCARV